MVQRKKCKIILCSSRVLGNEKINPYCFIESLFEELEEGQNIITGNGSACVVGFQAAKLKPEQRLWTNSGCATMGYDIPASIGACLVVGKNQQYV